MNCADDFPEAGCEHFSPSADKEPFTARMRFHQSWYRRRVLGLEPGPNPHARGVAYGNMLRGSDGRCGRNFLSAETFARALERFPLTSRGAGSNRLYCNMLGSQTMCFNLFGPLRSDRGMSLATRLLALLPNAPQDASVTGVSFEHAPNKALHLQDATSFDAFITYARPGGARGFIGIETKLTEPFSRCKYAFAPRYARWLELHRSTWWWRSEAEALFSDTACNQLWRNHLLAFSMLHQDAPDFTEGYCAVVYPRQDNACASAILDYRERLLPSGEATLLDWPLDTVCYCWEPALETDAERQWLHDFRVRYLDLDASEPAWTAYQARSQPLQGAGDSR
ncbi:MAG TPA: hypothetical protein VGM37_17660 [Armatimonadota bacterium]|jgi:hypothetical protein